MIFSCTLHVYSVHTYVAIVVLSQNTSVQDELAEVLVVLFDSKHRLAPFLTTILNTEVRTTMCASEFTWDT